MSYIVQEIPLETGVIILGVRGSHDVKQFDIDLSDWTESLGEDGTVEVNAIRSEDTVAYPVANVTLDGSTLSWVVDATDTGYAGWGKLMIDYTTADDGLQRSTVIKTYVIDSLGDVTAEPSTPDNWLDQMNEILSQITELTAEAETLDEGSDATASYDSDSGVLTLGIPTGATGATGATGETGVGISDISLTSTSDNVDTYTITLSDGTTYTFTVTNASTLSATDDGDGNVTLTT